MNRFGKFTIKLANENNQDDDDLSSLQSVPDEHLEDKN